MKRTLFLLAAAAVVFSACQKEEGSATSINGLELTATVEQHNGGTATKTYLDNLQVKWSTGDQVNVFTDAATPEKLTLTLAEGAGTTSGIFKSSETPTGNPQYAIYPASDDNSISGSTITFTLPATQNYVENSFDNGANVAVGTVSSGAIAYKNVCGVFKLTIYGNYTVSKIELSGKSDEKLNGSYSVDASSYTCTCETATTDSEKTITLNCGTSGVTLSPTTATTFYCVVPVGAFANGFVAKVYEKDNTTSYTYTELSTTSANSIVRSRVKAMPESTILPPAYQKVEYLQSSRGDRTSGQYIDTGIVPGGKKIGMVLDFQLIDGISNDQISGSMSGDVIDNFQWSLYSSDGITCWRWKLGTAYGFGAVYDTKRHTVKFNTSEGVVLDKTTITSTQYTIPLTNVYSIWLGARHSRNSEIQPCHAKFYSAKYYDYTDGSPVALAYFIPAKRNSDETTGMYDLVSGDLFVNQGTGAFTTGSAVTY